MHRSIETESIDTLKDFKNVFAGSNGQRVLARLLFEARYFSAECTVEELPLKNFATWLMQMVGGDNIEGVSAHVVNAVQEFPMKGE